MRTAVFAAAFLATASPAIADNYETGRRIYAIGEAAQEFCPGVTVSFSAALALKQAFGYAPTASEPEFSRAGSRTD